MRVKEKGVERINVVAGAIWTFSSDFFFFYFSVHLEGTSWRGRKEKERGVGILKGRYKIVS